MENTDSHELISVITPVYNNVRDIETCLLSVIRQTYTCLEHWIIDGGSTDGSLEVIQSYANKYQHIRWLSEKDEGIYHALNKGINKASGDWLYFLGSDDQLMNDTVIEEILTNSEFFNFDILYGNILLKENGIIVGEAVDINALKRGCTHHQATFIRKSVFDKLGMYNEKYKICADWAFTIKCFQTKNLNLKYIDKIIAIYSTIGFSNTANGNNPRLSDKNFNRDFFSLFEDFPLWERIQLRINDFLPKYLNPIRYFLYLKKLFYKTLS